MSARNSLAAKRLRRRERAIRHGQAKRLRHPMIRLSVCASCGRQGTVARNEMICPRCVVRLFRNLTVALRGGR